VILKQSKVASYQEEYGKLKLFAQSLAENLKEAERLWSKEKKDLLTNNNELKHINQQCNQII
jgi:hypothetical protein